MFVTSCLEDKGRVLLLHRELSTESIPTLPLSKSYSNNNERRFQKKEPQNSFQFISRGSRLLYSFLSLVPDTKKTLTLNVLFCHLAVIGTIYVVTDQSFLFHILIKLTDKKLWCEVLVCFSVENV